MSVSFIVTRYYTYVYGTASKMILHVYRSFCILYKIDRVRDDKDSLLHNYRSMKVEVTRVEIPCKRQNFYKRHFTWAGLASCVLSTNCVKTSSLRGEVMVPAVSYIKF